MASDTNVLKLKVAERLINYVYVGVRTGMRRRVEDYRRLDQNASTLEAAGNPDDVINGMTRAQIVAGLRARAKDALIEAVNIPRRFRGRAVKKIQHINSTRGAGTAQTWINDGLTLLGLPLTVADLQTDLQSMVDYAQGLIDSNQSGATLDQIAADIEANVEKEIDDWDFPDEDGYTDINLV